jgi:hypothetical protein
MTTTETPRRRRLAFRWPAITQRSHGSALGLVACFFAPNGPLKTISVPSVLVVAVVGVIAWSVSRARADKRWRAALERYAEQEQAKTTAFRTAPQAAAATEVR